MHPPTSDRVSLIVFAATGGRSAPERLLSGAHVANARDLVDLGRHCSLVDRVVVVTNSEELAATLGSKDRVTVERDRPDEPFHFGRRLVEVVEKYEMRRPLYFGASSAPLLAPESLREICGRLLGAERTVVTNNQGSADFFGVTPPEALRRIDVPGDQDNFIPYLLRRYAGLQVDVIEPAVENLFDVDTPADLAVMSLLGDLKRHARTYLSGLTLDTTALERAMPFLLRQRATISLVGRVNAAIWGQSHSDIPAIKRIYREESNMKAFGRDVRGEVRSLVGFLYEAVGAERLFAQFAEMSDAVFFDSRVLFHHLQLPLTMADRFASDLGDVDAIVNPTARAITAAARACAVPVVLGGHNIVSGALWALTQEAWNRADAGLLTPDA